MLNQYAFYTEEPVESREGVGKIVEVHFDGNKARTKIYGPFVRMGRETKEARQRLKHLQHRYFISKKFPMQRYRLVSDMLVREITEIEGLIEKIGGGK